MSFLVSGAENIVTFLVVLTVLVFVHELGHYLVARWSGVRIEILRHRRSAGAAAF